MTQGNEGTKSVTQYHNINTIELEKIAKCKDLRSYRTYRDRAHGISKLLSYLSLLVLWEQSVMNYWNSHQNNLLAEGSITWNSVQAQESPWHIKKHEAFRQKEGSFQISGQIFSAVMVMQPQILLLIIVISQNLQWSKTYKYFLLFYWFI